MLRHLQDVQFRCGAAGDRRPESWLPPHRHSPGDSSAFSTAPEPLEGFVCNPKVSAGLAAPKLCGQFSNLGSLVGSFSFNKDAVLYWGPKRGPSFRELPMSE